MAEANRAGGFRVLSLGYAEGPTIAPETLFGGSEEGLDTLLTDVVEAQDRAGFRHYITNDQVTLLNTFVQVNSDFSDQGAMPEWTSTHNEMTEWPTPVSPPEPRIGIQEAEPIPGGVAIRWDVALNLHRVHYRLYHQDIPFDWEAGIEESATVVELGTGVGNAYLNGASAQSYPYEFRLALPDTEQRYLLVRAVDIFGNEDQNRVSLTSTPLPSTRLPVQIDGDFSDWNERALSISDPDDVSGVSGGSAGPDWREIQISNDDGFLYIRFTSDHPFNIDGSPSFTFSRFIIFIDVDSNPNTGWARSADFGSDRVINGAALYRQALGVYNDGFLTPLSFSSTEDVTEVELSIPLSALRDGALRAEKIKLFFLNDEVNDQVPDEGAIDYEISE